MSNIGQNSHSVLIMHDTRVENAIGGRGSDEIVGNELNNVLTGNFGNDTLEGRGGKVTITQTGKDDGRRQQDEE